ncbi:MAG TPA: hypothetical protein VFP84_09145 [Kofleriaceae bacterium]|nr:hypothetical protein [Kofleriaceae bacterium]
MKPACLIAACALVACGNRHPENHEAPRDARQTRRVIEPSSDRVGPLPPYAIRADGIGPYKLGEKLSDLLEQLASGPRLELFEISGVVHRNVIRAEEDTVLVGGEQSSTASFVAVVGPEVARTESGVHVGSTRDELIAKLGAPIDDHERARDPRLVVPGSLPNLRAVISDDRVVAIVVAAAAPAASAASRATECERPAAAGKAMGACMTPAGELLEVGADDVVIRAATSERVLATPPKFPGLVFAAPLRGPDGRDELVVITRNDEPTLRSWWITAFHFEGPRLVRTVDATQLYQLSNANARWIGADLHDIDLYLDLTSRPDGIDVGGLLTTPAAAKPGNAAAATKIRDVVVISPASVTRRRAKPAPSEATDAGVVLGAPAAPPPVTAPTSTPTARPAPDAGVDATEPPSAEPDSNKP